MGNAMPAHVLGLVVPPERRGSCERTTRGVVELKRLVPGEYFINVPYKSTVDVVHRRRSDPLRAAARRDSPGRRDDPEGQPRVRQARARRIGEPIGWKATGSIFVAPDDWSNVEPDGPNPVEIQSAVPRLLLLAPDGRRWDVPIPKGAPDGYEIRHRDRWAGLRGHDHLRWRRAATERARARSARIVRARRGDLVHDGLRGALSDCRRSAAGPSRFNSRVPEQRVIEDDPFSSFSFEPHAEPALRSRVSTSCCRGAAKRSKVSTASS
jgi:hypothetical protein